MTDDRPTWVKSTLWRITRRTTAVGFAGASGVFAAAGVAAGIFYQPRFQAAAVVFLLVAALYAAAIQWMDHHQRWPAEDDPRKALRTVGVAVVVVVTMALMIAGGYPIGKLLRGMRDDRMSGDEAAAVIVRSTKPSLPGALADGWVFEDISASGSAVQARIVHKVPFDSNATFEPAIDQARVALQQQMCSSAGVQRLLRRRGTLGIDFVTAIGGETVTRSVPFDAAVCSIAVDPAPSATNQQQQPR